MDELIKQINSRLYGAGAMNIALGLEGLDVCFSCKIHDYSLHDNDTVIDLYGEDDTEIALRLTDISVDIDEEENETYYNVIGQGWRATIIFLV